MTRIEEMLKNVVCGECRQQAPAHKLNCSATKTICGQCFHAAPYHDSNCKALHDKMEDEQIKLSMLEDQIKQQVVCGACRMSSPDHTLECPTNMERCSECYWVEPNHDSECSKFEKNFRCPKPGCKFAEGHTGPHIIPPQSGEYAYEKAREAFSSYAAMNAPELPSILEPNWFSQLQVRLHRWNVKNFKSNDYTDKALGISEEIGEAAEALLGLMATSGRVSHIVLKSLEGIRGMDDEAKVKTKLADAIADSMIFATQLCTLLRVDFGTLYKETVEEVLNREWKKP